MEKLIASPCPFCGSNNLSERKKFVSCDNCGACGPFDEESAVGLWNERVTMFTRDDVEFPRQ